MRTRLRLMSQPARFASPKAMDLDSRLVRQRFDLTLARSPYHAGGKPGYDPSKHAKPWR